MGDKLTMSKKERERKTILDQVIAGVLPRRDARKRLNISNRQLKRIFKRYKKLGDIGLVHQGRGKPSGRAYAGEKKARILALYEEKYRDFGPTFASEKLLEDDQLTVKAETLRLWLKAAGLWQPHRKRKAYHARRARRPRFGELLQLDGSIHCWLEGIEKKQCLMNMVDDATSKTLALLDTGETTRAAFALLRWWITEAGIPLAIYVDLKSLYVSPKSLKDDDEEELVEPEWLTHFSKACKKLGIEVIKAYSPQAKGRVERNHAVYQDRFVKELKLKKITTIQEANKFLSDGFINKLNKKFAKPPADFQDAHVRLLSSNELDQILCWEFTRQVKNDWTVQFESELYQIEKAALQRIKPKQLITVRRHLDDSISFWHKAERLLFSPIKERPLGKKEEPKIAGIDLAECSRLASENKHKSPWAQFNPNWLSTKNTMKTIERNRV